MHFSEVLGQEAIKSRLKTAIATNHLAHAQLFVGAEGSGTLAMALALAREVLCGGEGLTEEQKQASHLKMDHLNHPDLHFVFPVATSEIAKTKPIAIITQRLGGHLLKHRFTATSLTGTNLWVRKKNRVLSL